MAGQVKLHPIEARRRGKDVHTQGVRAETHAAGALETLYSRTATDARLGSRRGSSVARVRSLELCFSLHTEAGSYVVVEE